MKKENYHIISNITTLKKWVDMIYSVGIFAVDVETDGLDVLTVNLRGLCFAVKSSEVAYLPLGENTSNKLHQTNYIKIFSIIKSVLEDPKIGKIGQNLKFVWGVLKRYNIELTGIKFDILVESYVLDSVAGTHDIKNLANRFLKYNFKGSRKIEKEDQNQLESDNDKISLKQTAIFAAEKVSLTLQLHQVLWPLLKKEAGLKKVFQEIEIPLIPLLSRIESNGVLIDQKVLALYSMELNMRMEVLKSKVHLLVSEPFNLFSTSQLKDILYNKQKLPVLKKTPRGFPSTDEEVLTKLALNYPLPKLILEYRSLAKIQSTYVNKLQKMIHPVSKRVHTSYHQTNTATGRLSSTEPNLQNIPVRNKNGHRIRQAFIAPSKSLILSADYSQIELRILAHLSHDHGLLSSFNANKDIHSITASEVFNTPLEKVTQEQRRNAKIINFGLIYGMSAFGLSNQLSLSFYEAQKYISLYFDRHPGILAYIECIRKKVTEQGYVVTLEGRRIYFPNIRVQDKNRKKSAERSAINAPIQGSAADIIKKAMISVDSWLKEEPSSIRMIMQVHDELVFEVKRDLIEVAKTKIRFLMETCFALDVPLKVNIGVGENWDQARPN